MSHWPWRHDFFGIADGAGPSLSDSGRSEPKNRAAFIPGLSVFWRGIAEFDEPVAIDALEFFYFAARVQDASGCVGVFSWIHLQPVCFYVRVIPVRECHVAVQVHHVHGLLSGLALLEVHDHFLDRVASLDDTV